MLLENDIICLMNRAGNVWDNSAMESFFLSLKTEPTARKVYRIRDASRADVFDYISRDYNPRRQHSNLDYLNPMEFEAPLQPKAVSTKSTEGHLNLTRTMAMIDSQDEAWALRCLAKHAPDLGLASERGLGLGTLAASG